jgi:nitronate monooxygenase
VTAPDWAARPLVLAPMAGGPSTVALATAVARGGLFPFLAGAYLTPQRLAGDIAELRSRTDTPFGVNVFAPSPDLPSMTDHARAYAAKLAPWAASAGVALGEPRYDDDAFGWPPAEVVERLQAVGTQVWTTVNDPLEADWARELGVDGLVAQGWEAGGHRGGPVDSGAEQLPVRELVTALGARSDLPLMAAGGVVSGSAAAELLEFGATAVALGTAFLACPEAGTAPVHVDALGRRDRTVVTRAFTGRSARALATTWTDLFTDAAPAAYPHVHHVTAPLRAHGKATGEAELVHLWAGSGHAEVRALPATELARLLVAELAATKSR